MGRKKSIRLYFMYISVILRSAMQYKLSFLLMIIGRFIVAFNGFLAVYFLFSGFQGIKGYSYSDILLCFSVIQMSFALAECCASGFATFSGIVKRGEFDRMLLRPRSPILQVLGSKFELGRIGAMISALIMLIAGIQKSHLTWNGLKIIALLLMVIGGTFLFAGLFMIGASSCFFAVEDTRFINILTYGAREHGKYPFDVYGKGIMRLCTYVVPYTLIQYYPLQYILGLSSKWYYAFYPLGVGLFMLACYAFWRFGMKHYESCGS
jgi:ABC-2 type transport system permease protein